MQTAKLISTMGCSRNSTTCPPFKKIPYSVERQHWDRDVLALAKGISVPNSGEILRHPLCWTVNGGLCNFTLEPSTALSGRCGDDLTTAQIPVTLLQLREDYLPNFYCPTQSKNFTWVGEQQQDLGIELNQFRLRSFHHNTCCDYSYLYKLELWVHGIKESAYAVDPICLQIG